MCGGSSAWAVTTEREQELERRVEELEQESNLGWRLFLFGLPLTLLMGAFDRLGQGRRERRRRREQERFRAWLAGLDERARTDLDALVERGLPVPDGATGDFAHGFRAHADVMQSLARETALWHVARADDARELLEAGGIDWNTRSVEWLRGFQAANAAVAERFGPSAA